MIEQLYEKSDFWKENRMKPNPQKSLFALYSQQDSNLRPSRS